MAARIKVQVFTDSGMGTEIGTATLSPSPSREDLQSEYYVKLTSLDTCDSYLWQFVGTPQSPRGVATGAVIATSTAQTASFSPDNDGPYMVCLTTVTGGVTSKEYAKLVAQTRFARITHPGTRERVANGGDPAIPVDINALAGWSNVQNLALLRLEMLIRRTAMTGRVLFVDANRGRGANAQNDPDVVVNLPGEDIADPAGTGIDMAATFHGDFFKITDAISYANDCVSRGETALSTAYPYTIFVQPGLYIEDVVFHPHIHVIGLGVPASHASVMDQSASVVIQAASTIGSAHYAPSGTGNPVVLKNLLFKDVANQTTPLMQHAGGTLRAYGCAFVVHGGGSGLGHAYSMHSSSAGNYPILHAHECGFAQEDGATTTYRALLVDAANAEAHLYDSEVYASKIAIGMNPSLYGATPTPLLDLCGTSVTSSADSCIVGAGHVTVRDGSVLTPGAGDAVVIAAGSAYAHTVELAITRATVPSLSFDTDHISGDCNLWLNGCTGINSITFPTAVPNMGAGTDGLSVGYVADFVFPGSGVSNVPSGRMLAATDMQQAVDETIMRIAGVHRMTATTYAVPDRGIAFVAVDTTGTGTRTVTLPANPYEGQGVFVADYVGNGAVAHVAVYDGTTTVTYTTAFVQAWYLWDGTAWRHVDNEHPVAYDNTVLPAGLRSASATTQGAIDEALNRTGGETGVINQSAPYAVADRGIKFVPVITSTYATDVKVPANPYDGQELYVLDASGNAVTHNITVKDAAGIVTIATINTAAGIWHGVWAASTWMTISLV